MFVAKCCVISFLVFVVLFGVFTHSFTTRLRYRLRESTDRRHEHERDSAFVRPAETRNLDCVRLFDQTQAQIYATNRITYEDPRSPDDLPTDCRSINQRNYFERRQLHEERDFPLAFVRAVYKDYRFLEMDLAATYSPQNTYCYILDSKASKTFHARMSSLSACFPNVFVTRQSFLMDSAGHNLNFAYFECLRLLDRFSWRYVVLLQNHDVRLKTNEELVKIFTWLNGTNDVSALAAPSKRIQAGVNYSFKGLKLFKNQTRNTRVHRRQPPILQFVKSLAQVSLSREAVDFMLRDLNLDRLLSALDWNTFGTDELVMGTLNANDAIDLPGGFTLRCLNRGIEIGSYTRLTYWQTSPSQCHSKMWRHRICIFGMEDILPNFLNSPFLTANKMMQNKDFGALVCWHELLFNRSAQDRGTFRLDRSVYLEMPQVRFNRERWKLGTQFRASKFACNG